MHRIYFKIFLVTTLFASMLVISCKKDALQDPSLIPGLTETNYHGDNFSLSASMEQLDMVQTGNTVHLYGPMALTDVKPYLPSRFINNIHFINEADYKLNFLSKISYLATSADKRTNEIKYQLQLSYLPNVQTDKLDNALIISVTDANPTVSWSPEMIGTSGIHDGYQTIITALTDTVPIVQNIYGPVHTIIPLTDYFTFSVESNQGYNALYTKSYVTTLYHHLIYHIAYDNSFLSDEQALKLAKEVVLGKLQVSASDPL